MLTDEQLFFGNDIYIEGIGNLIQPTVKEISKIGSEKYFDRPETPVFIGGMTQYIEFDEVISKSATETAHGSQPLGDIAAIGRGGKPLNNGHIHYQCEEPGYIMGLVAITPMIDYSQGNDFDLNLQTIDDLHKPALDGIGYQDLIQEQMVGDRKSTRLNSSHSAKSRMPSSA